MKDGYSLAFWFTIFKVEDDFAGLITPLTACQEETGRCERILFALQVSTRAKGGLKVILAPIRRLPSALLVMSTPTHGHTTHLKPRAPQIGIQHHLSLPPQEFAHQGLLELPNCPPALLAAVSTALCCKSSNKLGSLCAGCMACCGCQFG